MTVQVAAIDGCAPPASPATMQMLVARIERLPVSRRLMLVRVIVGVATFLDAYTVPAVAFARSTASPHHHHGLPGAVRFGRAQMIELNET
jgi:hypothetical protein